MKQLINDIVKKQTLLGIDAAWQNILMDVPPVLWFGNMESDKPKIVTIGANPSNREFYSKTGKKYNRFSYTKPYDAVQLDIAYNKYFKQNPYKGWFGAEGGGRVEAFMNGLDASYYEDTEERHYRNQAIHIDFFPFATCKKFRDISQIAESSLFATGWIDNSVKDLLDYINPKLIVVFGRLNNMCLDQYVPCITNNYVFTNWKGCPNVKLTAYYRIGRPKQDRLPPIICVSTYLGYPKGFTRQDLIYMAKEVYSKI